MFECNIIESAHICDICTDSRLFNNVKDAFDWGIHYICTKNTLDKPMRFEVLDDKGNHYKCDIDKFNNYKISIMENYG